MFEDLEDWEVRAVRDGQLLSSGFFRQSYPDDAVLLLMAFVRIKHEVPLSGWEVWKFWCTARHVSGGPQRTMVFELLPTGRPSCLADSKLGGLLQLGDGTRPD